VRKALILGSLGFFLAVFVQIAIGSIAHAKGPYGNIHVGNWSGGAFTDDNTGAFSHCAATTAYGNGIILVVGQNASNSWLLSFASPNFHLKQGETVPIDLTFDGQAEARIFASANSNIMATAILPPNVARTFQKASLMVAVSGSTVLNFNLTSTGPLLAALSSCVSTVKAGGINSAGDFSAPKAAAKTDAPNSKSAKAGTQTGTGYVISANGHIITNHHVIDGCTSDIKAISRETPQPRCAWSTAMRPTISRCCRGRRSRSRLSSKSGIARSIPAIPWLRSASPITACCRRISR